MFNIARFTLRGVPWAALVSSVGVIGCSNDADVSGGFEPAGLAATASALETTDPVEEVVSDCPAALQCWDRYASCAATAMNPDQDCRPITDECNRLVRQCGGYDDSAAPVYVHIKTCKTTTPGCAHEAIDCRLEPEYALVGGGAKTITYQPANSTYQRSDFLTESRPLADGRTWRASSRDHLIDSQHDLVVYAIGMRLEGVNSQKLRENIRWKELTLAANSAPLRIDSGWRLISGGGKATPSSPNGDRFLTRTRFTAYHEWEAATSDHMVPAAGSTTVWMLELKDQLIEGFGALEIKQLIAHSDQKATGFSTSSVQVEPGWALIGMGGAVSNLTGSGRMLTAIAPGADNRTVSVTSRDYINQGAGITTAYAIMARKLPGTHGLCNAGSALQAQVDSCVANICQTRAACCSTAWDSTCVDLVQSVCGRSCTEYTCALSRFEPARWNYNFGTPDSPIYQNSSKNVASNCANYALNRYGGSKMPGDTLNLLPEDERIATNADRQYALALGEGLIPVAVDGECSENRTKVFWTYFHNDFHWRRLDADGRWSEKWWFDGMAQHADSFVPGPSNGGNAYFCACNLELPNVPPPFNP